MKRKEFIRIVIGAMEEVEKYNDYTCNLLDKKFYNCYQWIDKPSSPIRKDYISVFSDSTWFNGGRYISADFGLSSPKRIKQVRLNALAMYLAQSLAFKTYKDL